jgi:hypothetical protein
MNIYLVLITGFVRYEEYDGIVVIAESKEDAKILSQELCHNFKDNLEITDIGVAHEGQERGAVLSSFNAA